MDENVVFDPDSKGTSADVNASSQQSQDESQIASVAPAEQSSPQESPADATVQQEEVPPAMPPPPLGTGFLGGRLVKIIIGVIIVIVLIFLITLFLPKQKSVKSVKLVWWGLWEDSRVIQPILDDFHRIHPEITVEYIKQDPQNYRDRLLARIRNNTGPDIFLYHNTWYVMLSDVLLPFSSDVITPDEFKEDFYPIMQSNLIQNGAIYGIPMGADSLSLFVNTDLLRSAGVQVPRNWDDFMKAARKMTVQDDRGNIKTAGAALGAYSNVTHAPDIISLLFVQQGVNMTKFITSSSNEADALDFYTSFARGDQKVWDGRLDESLLAFAKGNLAMYFGYSWDVFAIQKLNGNLPFKIYSVPGLYEKSPTIASYWADGISSKGQNQAEAALFMHYLAQKDTAQNLYTQEAKVRAFGEPYARRDLASGLQSNSLVYPFVSQMENASSSFFASNTQDGDSGINSLSNNYLENAINSMLSENTTTSSVVDTLEQGIGQVFSKYASQ